LRSPLLPLAGLPRPDLPPGPYFVAGVGRAGLSAAQALATRFGGDQVRAWAESIPPASTAAVRRLREQGVHTETGDGGVEFLRRGPAPGCVVKSPGIPPDEPVLTAAAQRGAVMIDELELGWRLTSSPLIAVTGTNGKSTTAHLIAAILGAAGARVTLAGNTHFGPPLSAVTDHFDAVVCEASSFQLEACPALVPEVAVLTNLSLDHVYRHGSLERYRTAKRRLFVRETTCTPLAVVNGDDPFGADLAGEVSDAGGRAVTFGGRVAQAGGADFRFASTSLDFDSGVLFVETAAGETRLETSLVGAHNAANAAAAMATGFALGIDPRVVADAIAGAVAVPGRLEPVPGLQPFDVVVDYAHNPDGIRAALRTAREIVARRGQGRVAAVLSALPFTGPAQRHAMGVAAAKLADRLILTTERWSPDAPSGPPAGLVEGAEAVPGARFDVVPGRHRAIESALRGAAPGDAVMILGRGEQEDELFELGRHGPFDDRAVARDTLGRIAIERGFRSRGRGPAVSRPGARSAPPPPVP